MKLCCCLNPAAAIKGDGKVTGEWGRVCIQNERERERERDKGRKEGGSRGGCVRRGRDGGDVAGSRQPHTDK